MPSPQTTEITRRYGLTMAADVAFPIAFKTGNGCRIEDWDGNHYIDFIGGYGVVNTGWQHPEILAAMAQQLQSSVFAFPWLPTREATDLAETLLRLAPDSISKCAKATGGADANEVAVKALFAQRSGTVLVIGRAYHGGTTRTLSLSDSQTFGLPPSPVPQPPRVPPAYCYRCPYGKTYPGCSLECAEAVETAAKADPSIKGVLLEPIIGSGGAIIPPPEYFQAIQEICQRRNLALILDEVITGCGRLGTFFAADAFHLKPDAITLAKGLSGGYAPIGVALLSSHLSESLTRHEDVSATMAWTQLACGATLANLRVIRENNLVAQAAESGAVLLAKLREMFERIIPAHVGEIRGRGLLIGIELVTDQTTKEPARQLAKRIIVRCLRNGLMLGTSWDWNTLIIMPPLILDDSTMDEALNILETSLKQIPRLAR